MDGLFFFLYRLIFLSEDVLFKVSHGGDSGGGIFLLPKNSGFFGGFFWSFLGPLPVAYRVSQARLGVESEL